MDKCYSVSETDDFLNGLANDIRCATLRRHEIGCTAHVYYGACVDGCETDAQLRERRKAAL